MKKILVVLFIYFSMISFAQEPIYNINEQNMHLYSPNYNSLIFTTSINNSYEFYNNDKIFNNTNLYANINTKSISSNFGINAEYNYLGKNNNISSFEGMYFYYFDFGDNIIIITHSNFGIINYNIDYLNLQARYTFKKSTPVNLSFNSQNFNIGVGINSVFRAFDNLFYIGLNIDHVNQAKLPVNNDKLPAKYSATISSLHRKLRFTASYNYQDKYFLNPVDMSYYYDILSYAGINIFYFFDDYKKFNLSFGYKYLSNFNDIFSMQIGRNFGDFHLYFSSSLMQEKELFAQFYQVGIKYSLYEIQKIRRTGGNLRYL